MADALRDDFDDSPESEPEWEPESNQNPAGIEPESNQNPAGIEPESNRNRTRNLTRIGPESAPGTPPVSRPERKPLTGDASPGEILSMVDWYHGDRLEVQRYDPKKAQWEMHRTYSRDPGLRLFIGELGPGRFQLFTRGQNGQLSSGKYTMQLSPEYVADVAGVQSNPNQQQPYPPAPDNSAFMQYLLEQNRIQAERFDRFMESGNRGVMQPDDRVIQLLEKMDRRQSDFETWTREEISSLKRSPAQAVSSNPVSGLRETLETFREMRDLFSSFGDEMAPRHYASDDDLDDEDDFDTPEKEPDEFDSFINKAEKVMGIVNMVKDSQSQPEKLDLSTKPPEGFKSTLREDV